MNARIRTIGTTIALLAAGALAATAGAQPGPAAKQPSMKHKSAVHVSGSAKLKAQARVSADSATAIAMAQVPNGKIQSAELENEKGKLLYSYDIKIAGKSGIEEVQVDALTGAVLAHEHETAAAEASEKKAEAKEAKAASKGVAKKP
jgi:hypothetical protein